MPRRHHKTLRPTAASVDDVALRWGREPSESEAALIDLRLHDVERMILRRIPDLWDAVRRGEVAHEDVVQVEADAVVRLMRNPEGYISETDGDYSYQIAKELSTGHLTILDDEWEALGHRQAKFSILVPEPMLDGYEDELAADLLGDGSGILVVDVETDLPIEGGELVAVTRDSLQLWLKDATSPKANPQGWVPVGGAAAALQDGLSHGTLLMWDEFDLKWRAAEHTWSNGAATLEWNPGLSEWVAVEPLLDWLSNVDASHRADMSALVNNDALFFDESSHRWVVRGAYTSQELDTKLSGILSGLAHKPAVQNVVDTPPSPPERGHNYIIGLTPTDAWTGHANEVVFWSGTEWVFVPPSKGDTHTVLATNRIWNWNGSEWVDVGTPGGSTLAEMTDVDMTSAPDDGQVLTFVSADNAWRPADAMTSLGMLTDVSILDGGPGTDEVLVWDGVEWVNAGLMVSDLFDTSLSGLADGEMLVWSAADSMWVNKAGQLINLADVGITDPPGDGQVLTFTGGVWTAQDASNVSAVADLTDVFLVGDYPGTDEILVWNGVEWTNRLLTVADLGDVSLSGLADGETIVWSDADSMWVNKPGGGGAQSIGDLVDVDYTTPPAANQVLRWDDTTYTWAPSDDLTFAELDTRLTDLKAWVDQDLANAQGILMTEITDAIAEAGRLDAALSDQIDLQLAAIRAQTYTDISDLENTTITNDATLKTELTGDINAAKGDLERVISSLASGLSHGESFDSFVNTPPGSPIPFDLYIVGEAPTVGSDFENHANQIAYWDGDSWEFTLPEQNAAHLCEADNSIYHWNGSKWVKVGTTAAGASALKDLNDVRAGITPSTGQVLAYNSDSKWAPVNVAVYPRVLGFQTSDNDLSRGKTMWYTITAQPGHTYRITGVMSAKYNNDSVGMSGSLHVKIGGGGDQYLSNGTSGTLGSFYYSSFTVQQLHKPDVIGNVEYSLWLDSYSEGVVINKSFLLVEDMGPVGSAAVALPDSPQITGPKVVSNMQQAVSQMVLPVECDEFFEVSGVIWANQNYGVMPVIFFRDGTTPYMGPGTPGGGTSNNGWSALRHGIWLPTPGSGSGLGDIWFTGYQGRVNHNVDGYGSLANTPTFVTLKGYAVPSGWHIEWSGSCEHSGTATGKFDGGGTFAKANAHIASVGFHTFYHKTNNDLPADYRLEGRSK